jgi:hypothetical protein
VTSGQPSTLNGVLYTGITYAMIERAAAASGMSGDPTVVAFLDSMNNAMHECLEPAYPMPSRTPSNRDQEGPDDYHGLSAWCSCAPNGQQVASDLLAYGSKTTKWFKVLRCGRWLDNTSQKIAYADISSSSFLTKLLNWPVAPWGSKPILDPWFGRFPGLTFSFRQASGKFPIPFMSMFAAGGLLIDSIFGSSTPSNWYFDWATIVTNENAKHKSVAITLISKLWRRKLHKEYSNGMMGVWAAYSGNSNFPLANFFQE